MAFETSLKIVRINPIHVSGNRLWMEFKNRVPYRDGFPWKEGLSRPLLLDIVQNNFFILVGKRLKPHGARAERASARRQGGAADARRDNPGGGEKLKGSEELYVLMADDDEDDCILARDALRMCKARGTFFCVEDGIELMDYLCGTGKYAAEANTPLPALILLDLNMPRKDGREVLREIQSMPALRSIPIVVLTTSEEESDIFQTRAMGASSFITKPSDFGEWVEIMDSLAKSWLH
jgi:CheY-like chemotaxis protein